MNHLSIIEKETEFVRILTTATDDIELLDRSHSIIKKAINAGILKNVSEHISYVNNPTENLEELDNDIKEKITALKALCGYLYWNKYLYPSINAFKYYYMVLDVNNYITMLNDLVTSETYINDLLHFHKCLKNYSIEFTKEILKLIDCNLITTSRLLNSIINDNVEEFIKIIDNNKLDLNNALDVCNKHENYIFSNDIKFHFETEWKNIPHKEFISILELMEKGLNKDIENESEVNSSLKTATNFLLDIFNNTEIIEQIEESFGLIPMFYNYIDKDIYNIIVTHLTKNDYIYFTELFKLVQKLYLGENNEKFIFFHNSKMRITYNILCNNQNNFKSFYEDTQTNNEDSTSTIIEFNLPENLFERNEYLTYQDKNEFYNLNHDLIISKSPNLLCSLINELADWGYINNDNETKTLFAYRLTGKKILRPEELKAIQWNEQGRSKRGYSLLYLIKKLTYDTGTYSKVKEFFTGPEWGVKLNEDANEKNASIRFKRLLHKVSPEDFTNPDKK